MKRFCPLLLLILLAGCGEISSGRKKIAIAGARLEPGGGKPAIPYSIVVVEDGKFKAVGEQAEVPLPKDSEVVNGLEQTLTPTDPNGTIEPGKPANLMMKGARETRTMKEGVWQQ
jgi:cytosine/adenosine deaminase-related metal-dependent hydrolase